MRVRQISWRQRRAVVEALIVVAALAACDADQRSVGPGRQVQGPALELVGLDPFSTTLGIDDPYNPTNSTQLSNYAKLTLVHLTISGTTDVLCIKPPPPDVGRCGTEIPDHFALDARGRWVADVFQACYEGVQIQFTAPGYSSGLLVPGCPHYWYTPQDPLTRTVVVRGQGTAWWTGRSPCQGCWYYSGDKAITVEPAQVDFTVGASPTTVNFKDTVTVTVTVAPWQVDGQNVPWGVDSVKWVPAFGTQTTPCAWSDFTPYSGASPTRTCRKPFTRSGTMTVFATANGVTAQQSVAITVTPPSLHVTASPTSVADSAGVTFTAAVTPSTITWTPYWSWRPDVGSGGISSQCQTSEKTCTRGVWKSGWMKATVFLSEYTLIDSVHVRLIPCPTGDSVLDLQEVRQALHDALQASNVSDPNFHNRKERAGIVLRNLQTGAIEIVRFDSLYADWCISNNDINYSTGTHRLLGEFHTHPYSPLAGDSVAYCPKLELDPATNFEVPVQPPDSVPFGLVGAGGSVPDWDLLKATNQQLIAAGQPAVDEYIISLDNIIRLNHGQTGVYTPTDYKGCPTWLQ